MEFHAENGRLPPGIRFHPTDVELLMHYLKRKLLGKRIEPELVAEVEIYQFHPADLKEKACLNKDLDWYFFCPRGRKYCIGDRTNRATETGYWKATGKDRAVSYRERTVGKVKTLVFHMGKPPKGERTNWVMHEYRLEDAELGNNVVHDAYVLCKIFEKSGWGPRNAEQYGDLYKEEEWNDAVVAEDQNASGVTNPTMIMNSNSHPEIYSCDVTLSGVDQEAPTLTSNSVAANIVLELGSDATPKADLLNPVPKHHHAHVAELASDATPKADLLNTVPNDHHDHVVELAADTTPIAGLLNPVLNNPDVMWCADDFTGLYDDLEDIPVDFNDLWPLSDCKGKSDNDLGMTLDELLKDFDS